MCPTLATHNKRNKGTADPKRRSDVFLRLSSSGTFTNVAHGICCEFSGRVRFAPGSAFGMRSAPVAISRCHHALACGIHEVFRVGSEEQMADIDTSRVISTRAVMADVHLLRNRAYEQDPRHSRRMVCAPLESHECPFAVCAPTPEQLTSVWVFGSGSSPLKPLKRCSSRSQVVTGFAADRTTVNNRLATNAMSFVGMCKPHMSSSISCSLTRSAPLGIAALGRESGTAPRTVHDSHKETSKTSSYLQHTIAAHITQATS